MPPKIELMDCTLRDGAQAEGVSFSVEDKLRVARALDELGLPLIEAGNPASNPKDAEFFARAKSLTLRAAKLVAFGATHRRDTAADEDEGLRALLSADTQVVSLVGKARRVHAERVLRVSPEENLRMVFQSVAYLVSRGRRVLFDAEHFFDGFLEDREYALETLRAASLAGADTLVLCDTNGGAQPDCAVDTVRHIVRAFPGARIGVHLHDDGGMATAGTVLALQAGAQHAQGTLLGFGERCGNANLTATLCNLQIKRNRACIPEENLPSLSLCARRVASVANIILPGGAPFVGASAFAHKGGMHIDGMHKLAGAFEHMNPALVGNERRFLMSEMSGRSTILSRLRALDPTLTRESPETARVLAALKEKERRGYQYESAEASFELLVQKTLGRFEPFFELAYFKTIGERITSLQNLPASTSTAVVKITVRGCAEVTAAEGQGPVNALDRALRRALSVFYPEISCVSLTDYRVRILDARLATASATRVLIESTDGERSWTTVGISTDIIGASWKALSDSMEYKLMIDRKQRA